MIKTATLSWKDVAYPHAWIGNISKMQALARGLGYRMFAWNGRVYDVSTCESTFYLEEDVK